MSKTTTALLTVVAVLLGLNLIVATRPAIAATGPTVQCCLPNGACVDVDSAICVAVGGVPGSPGTNCVTGLNCVPGACCSPDSNRGGDFCLDNFNELSCAELCGTYQGPGTDCANVNCGVIDCPADIDGDGTVGILDFLDLLAAWGACP